MPGAASLEIAERAGFHAAYGDSSERTVYLTKTNDQVVAVSPPLPAGDAAWLVHELRKRLAEKSSKAA